MGDKTEVRIGRSNVKYGGVDLGFTEGEITMTYTPEFRDFTPDQSTLVLKKFLLNEGVALSVPLAQSLAKSLARGKAFGAGELKAGALGGGGSSTSDGATVAGATEINVQAAAGSTFTDGNFILVGTGLTAEMVEIDSIATDTLTLKAETPLQFDHADGEAIIEVDPTKVRIAIGNPLTIELPTAVLDIIPIDGSDPIRIYKAVVGDELELVLQKGEETIVEVPFVGIGDDSRANGDQLMSIGDQSV